MSITERTRLQPKVYQEGVQFMKARIKDVHDELDQVQCQYHQQQQVDEDQFIDYLKNVDKHLLRANTELRKRLVCLEVIDSETRLVSLLNSIREADVDPDTIQYLTEYWDNVKCTVDGLNALVSKFQVNVFNRLKKNYNGSFSVNSQTDECSGYTEDISSYASQLENVLSNTQILLKSFHSGLHQNLFDSSRFVDLLVVSCDCKAFPVLRFVADIALKVHKMCDIAHAWLARDEHFMQEIHSFIREARYRTRQREEDLKCEQEKQKRQEKSLKATSILLQNNRDKLQRIQAELHVLEEQVRESQRDKRSRSHLLQQKESMAHFLALTLSHTKRVNSLQAKRSKLCKQVSGLRELVGVMEGELGAMRSQVQVKAEERLRLREKVEHGEQCCRALQGDMDRFTASLQHVQTEVAQLTGRLLELEIIHRLKTSPEQVDQLYDRPSTVKLAPSLREKIKQRNTKK